MKEKVKIRKDGRYGCKYKDKMFYGKTPEEAQRKRDEYKYRCEHEIGEIRHISVSQYADEWLPAYKADVGAGTYRQYKIFLDKLVEALGDYYVSSVTPDDAVKLLKQYIGTSKSQISKAMLIYRSFFDAAKESGYSARNPFRSMVVKPPKGTAGTHRAITDDERRLIETTPHRMRKAAMIMLYSGLRRGELLALRNKDVNGGKINVNHSLSFAHMEPELKEPKTKSSVRQVPILKPIEKYFMDEDDPYGFVITSAKGEMCTESAWDRSWASYLSTLEATANGCPKRWYHLTREWKNQHPKEYAYYLKLKKNKRTAGDAEEYRLTGWKDIKIRPHDLRHSFCEWCITNGIDLKTVSMWMGHSDHQMVMRIYDHVMSKRETNAVNQLNNLFSNIE